MQLQLPKKISASCMAQLMVATKATHLMPQSHAANNKHFPHLPSYQ